MGTKNKLGKDLILRRIAQGMYLNKQEMRRIMALMSIVKMHMRKKYVSCICFSLLAASYSVSISNLKP